MQKHVIITLANGLNVLGGVVSKTDTAITLFMPMVIVTQSDADVPYFQLIPYSNYSRLSSFNKKLILSVSTDPIPPVVALWEQIVAYDQKKLEQKEAELPENLEEEFEASNEQSDDNVVSIFKSKPPTVH